MSDGPVRLTKQRLDALRQIVQRGEEQLLSELRDNYGIDLDKEPSDWADSLVLLEPGELDTANELIEILRTAQDAWTILSRRYGP